MPKSSSSKSRSAAAKPTGKRLSIRYARPGEMEDVWRLDLFNLKENWDLHPATGGPPSLLQVAERHVESVRSWFDPSIHRMLVAVRDERIIGLVWYSLQQDRLFDFPCAFVYSVVVHPKYRRQGIARRMLNEVRRRAYKGGAKYMRLAVLHNNNRAMNLYRNLGFFEETHYLLARLEPTGPEKAKQEAAEKKRKTGK